MWWGCNWAAIGVQPIAIWTEAIHQQNVRALLGYF